ncbi:unnamed protein product [Nezara viridula]|uniref:Uncharacterized protein n=1 Tax=Nezara viridula TaxID=85310 RepID=A0A9P0HFB9_NEZVI|nr:unnamed protein product [Nezara viridula]
MHVVVNDSQRVEDYIFSQPGYVLNVSRGSSLKGIHLSYVFFFSLSTSPRLIEVIALKADSWIQDQRCPSCLGKCDDIRVSRRALTIDAIYLVKAGEFPFPKEPHQLELDPVVTTCYGGGGIVVAFSHHMGIVIMIS